MSQPSASTFATIQAPKWKSTDTRQHVMTDKLIKLVTRGLLPLSFVENEDFRDFSETLNPGFTLPSRKHLSNKLLPLKTASLLGQLKSLFTSASDLSLTIDIWSSRDMRSYLGITCHFIHHYQMQSVMLCCTRFRGSPHWREHPHTL